MENSLNQGIKNKTQALDSGIETIKDTSSKAVKDLRKNASALAHDGVDEVRKDLHKVQDYISAHPAKALAFAAVGGFLLAALCSRKKTG